MDVLHYPYLDNPEHTCKSSKSGCFRLIYAVAQGGLDFSNYRELSLLQEHVPALGAFLMKCRVEDDGELPQDVRDLTKLLLHLVQALLMDLLQTCIPHPQMILSHRGWSPLKIGPPGPSVAEHMVRTVRSRTYGPPRPNIAAPLATDGPTLFMVF